MYPREVLIDSVWGGEGTPAARKTLRTALWRVRSTVDAHVPEGKEALRTEGDAVGFNASAGHWLDVEEFESLVQRARALGTSCEEEEAKLLRAAIALYDGDALEGMYDEWCLYERERLRLMYYAALERLAACEERLERWDLAIPLGQRLLALDPLLEHVHRALMRYHARGGNRTAALRQYEECCRVLQSELQILPMEETTQLYREILAGDRLTEPRIPTDEEPRLNRVDRLLAHVDEALTELRGLTLQLEESRGHLIAAVKGPGGTGAATPLPARGTLL
jgi:DNA-binding SARP family transcriptional activator